VPPQPVDVIKRSSRWAGQRWLLDAVIGLVGPEWDQGRVAYYAAACGQDSQVDFTAVRPRIRKYDDLAREFSKAARRRELLARDAEHQDHRASARESYFSGAAGITVVALSPWIWMALAGWALFGLGLSGCVPQLFSAAGHADPAAAGTNVSRVVGLGYLGMLAGPAAIGWMTRLVALNYTCLFPALLLVIATATAGILRSGTEREPKPEMAQRPTPHGAHQVEVREPHGAAIASACCSSSVGLGVALRFPFGR
jgi:hypothetical protein